MNILEDGILTWKCWQLILWKMEFDMIPEYFGRCS